MAFARQYFRSAYRKFGSGQSRTDKTTLLLASESERKVRLALQIAKCSRKPGGPQGVPMPQNGKVSAVIVLNVKFHWYVLSLIIFLAMERVLQAISITSETTLITIKYIAPRQHEDRYRRGLVWNLSAGFTVSPGIGKMVTAYPVKDIYFFNERPFWRLPLSILSQRCACWSGLSSDFVWELLSWRERHPRAHAAVNVLRYASGLCPPGPTQSQLPLHCLLCSSSRPQAVPTGQGRSWRCGRSDPLVAPPPSAVSERIDGSTSPQTHLCQASSPARAASAERWWASR